jgi:transcription initiation factor TFIIE subunit alpha
MPLVWQLRVKMAKKKTTRKVRKVKTGIHRLSSKLTQSVVNQSIGEDAMPVVEYLKGKRDISEFQIAQKIKAEVGFVRKTLYALQNYNLVTYFRKKDREKGWYISYWTFNQKGVPELALSIKRNRLQMLKERLQTEEKHKGLFYICPQMCSRMEFEKATEVDFKCPECGKPLQHQDNGKTIERIRENIMEMEQEKAVA